MKRRRAHISVGEGHRLLVSVFASRERIALVKEVLVDADRLTVHGLAILADVR